MYFSLSLLLAGEVKRDSSRVLDGKGEPVIAVVTASYGSYDDPHDIYVKDVSGNVDYYYFTDQTVDLKNCIVDTFPYHLHDDKMQVPGAKNSIKGIEEVMRTSRGRKARQNMMASKYYKVMAWRIPSLYKYRYILYHDANFLVGNPNLRRDLLVALKNYSVLNIGHPRKWGGIHWEAVEAR